MYLQVTYVYVIILIDVYAPNLLDDCAEYLLDVYESFQWLEVFVLQLSFQGRYYFICSHLIVFLCNQLIRCLCSLLIRCLCFLPIDWRSLFCNYPSKVFGLSCFFFIPSAFPVNPQRIILTSLLHLDAVAAARTWGQSYKYFYDSNLRTYVIS